MARWQIRLALCPQFCSPISSHSKLIHKNKLDQTKGSEFLRLPRQTNASEQILYDSVRRHHLPVQCSNQNCQQDHLSLTEVFLQVTNHPNGKTRQVTKKSEIRANKETSRWKTLVLPVKYDTSDTVTQSTVPTTPQTTTSVQQSRLCPARDRLSTPVKGGCLWNTIKTYFFRRKVTSKILCC